MKIQLLRYLPQCLLRKSFRQQLLLIMNRDLFTSKGQKTAVVVDTKGNNPHHIQLSVYSLL